MANYIMLSALLIFEGILYIRYYSSCWAYKSRLVQQSLCQFSSVTQLCLTLGDPMDCSTPGFPIHHQLPELAQTHVHWVGDAIQPSHPVIPFSSSLQSFSVSESFPMSCFSPLGHQNIEVSASASLLPINIQDWFLLGLTGLITLQFKGLSRVFSSTTVWKHQFFGAQPSFWSNSHIQTWLLEKP